MIKLRSINDLWWVGLAVVSIAATMLAIALRPSPPAEIVAANTVVVYKSATCNCCSKWVDHLKQAGLRVEVHDEEQMSLVKQRLGVPEAVASCHTATVNGYFIEGHVPAQQIKHLLATHPKARGLAVPGMPAGSPGMESGAQIDPYDVLLIADGPQAPAVFAHYGPPR